MEKAVETRELTRRYGVFTAVDRLDLDIRRGEVFGLLGPNGAGKTTTILMLLGMTEPSSGTVRVLGLDPARDSLKVKARTGYLAENVEFYEDLTARENLAYLAELNGLKGGAADRAVREALETVEMAERADSPAGTFSKGMRQRLGLASVLLKKPELVILDEPTSGIDPEGVEKILSLIRRMAEESGITVLLSSHMLHSVQKVCDRVGIMFKSSMIACGTIGEIGRSILGERGGTIRIASGGPGPIDGEKLGKIKGLKDFRRTGDTMTASFDEQDRSRIIREIIECGCLPVEIRGTDYSLEEIYLRYFREV